MIINNLFSKINSLSNHPYYYLSPHSYAVGNCAEEIYLGLIKARYQGKKLVILYMFDLPYIFKYKLTNKSLLSLESNYIYQPNRYLLFIIRLLLTIIYIPLRVSTLIARGLFNIRLDEAYSYPCIGRDDLFLPGKIKDKPKINSIVQYNWKEKFNYEFNFIIDGKSNIGILNCIEKLGIPKVAWFVCLHVRESGFRNDKGRREYRNSNIKNYIPAIKEIVSKGGWVVRMGDDSMTPLPEMKNVIDYPFTEFKSDFMDLFLIKNCRFFIGCQSGIFDVAKLFSKPTLLLNMYNWTFGGPLHIKDRGILKHIYSRKDNRYLSIKEMFSGGWEMQNMNGIVNNFVYVENSKEEIFDAVIEYLGDIENTLFLTSEIHTLSNSYRKEQAYSILKQNRLATEDVKSDMEELAERYRFLSQIEGASGYICNKYLDNNWEYDSLNLAK